MYKHPYYESYQERDAREHREQVDREFKAPSQGVRVLADGTVQRYKTGE